MTDLSEAQLQQRRGAALKHGAGSELAVRPVATVQKRRLLRQIGLRQADLEGIGLALLDNWARSQGKVELMDAYAAQHGFLDEAGIPREFTRIYFTALNSARLSLVRLREHLREANIESGAALGAYLKTIEQEVDHHGDDEA